MKPPQWNTVVNTDAGEDGFGGLVVSGGPKHGIAKALPAWVQGASSTLRKMFGSFDCVHTWLMNGVTTEGDCLVLTDNSGSCAVQEGRLVRRPST